MISNILIEALARRAKALCDAEVPGADYIHIPDAADFRKAFEEELERFAISSTARPVDTLTPASPKRASLLPSSQPSKGVGLGQLTGGTAESDAAEAKRILVMLDNVDGEVIGATCGQKAISFITEMRMRRANGGPLCVTEKQVFYLRDLRYQLLEKGYV